MHSICIDFVLVYEYHFLVILVDMYHFEPANWANALLATCTGKKHPPFQKFFKSNCLFRLGAICKQTKLFSAQTKL